MAKKTFFSFHYGRDAWRAAQVRNSGVTKPRNARGFVDKAEWEQVKRKGKPAVKRWIDNQLKHTSVTVVLIGKETCDRGYVKYEIEQSHKRGNTIIGVRIHNLKNHEGQTDSAGVNPFDKCKINHYRKEKCLSDVYDIPIYDWVEDDGYNNMNDWIDKAIAKGR
jgi:hypothetical protein